MKYPAFFSYSHADDNAYGGYMREFHKEFTRILRGRFGQQGLTVENPFLDHIDMRTNDELDATLRRHVKESFALFIFIGPGYVRSDYCLTELQYFAEKLNAVQEDITARVWIIELEPLNEELRKKLDARFQTARVNFLRSQIRRSFYDDVNKTLKDLNLRDQRDLLSRIAQDLATRYGSARTASVPSEAWRGVAAGAVGTELDVLLGCCTDDLAAASKELAGLLTDRKQRVKALDLNDVNNLDDKSLQVEFARARIAVLPVSMAKVLARRDAGGHVTRQMLAMQAEAGPRCIVWNPTGMPALAAAALEDEQRHLEPLANVLRVAQSVSAAELAQSLCAPAVQRRKGPRVFIEMNDNQDDRWEDIGEDLGWWWRNGLTPEGAAADCPDVEGLFVDKLYSEVSFDVDAQGVVVFRDPENLLLNKCDAIKRNIWRGSPSSITPGLIVILESETTTAQAVTGPDPKPTILRQPWPMAKFARRTEGAAGGESPRFTLDDASKESLRRYFRRIARSQRPPSPDEAIAP